MTLVLQSMAAAPARLTDTGLTLGPDSPGGGGLIDKIEDPDGNALTFAKPPKGS